MKKRILFVDDDPNVLQGLRRMLHPMRGEWDMKFAASGREALDLMEQVTFDVVVSDMRMPGMDGSYLLAEVRKKQPRAVRMILSGYADDETVLRAIGPTHQYLAKPCNAKTLRATVARACALHDLLADEKMQQLVGSVKSLPSVPTLYQELLHKLRSPDVSIRDIGKTISRDMGMTAKILQCVNSAFFGLPRRIADPGEAAGILGLDTIKAMVLSVEVFSQFQAASVPGFSIERLWSHSMAVGAFAGRISKQEKHAPKATDDALMAGLLHDAGKLLLAANLPDRWAAALKSARERQITLSEAETNLFGTTHAEVGAYLFGVWGLPDPIVEAVAFHHRPGECPARGFSSLAAVHAADVFEQELAAAAGAAPATALDKEYLAAAGLLDHVNGWRECCAALTERTA